MKDFIPLKYQKNDLSVQEQKKLFSSFVVIAGCGALGQSYAQSFARLGIGNICIYDPDVFEETNFNRQIFLNNSNIGLSKAEETKKALEKINPDLNYLVFKNKIEDEKFLLSLNDSDIAVDALDNFKSRIYLEKICKEFEKP
ncbi:MAG: ThiF family adenylyltransferase, partial [Desulfobacteraceae bacterium]|nr:ThiF family adenylyltransferase [Desulfobacteraceae bacterium]